MNIGTHTQVAAVSKIKMATAFLFLGGAALAASAAGGLAGKLPKNGPDLVIKSIVLETTEEPEGKGGPDSGYNIYTITYENIGNAPVTKPFNIIVQATPKPYMTWGGGEPVLYIVNMGDPKGDGYSGGFENLGGKAPEVVNNQYVIPVNSPYGDSSTYPGLNKYMLDPVVYSPSGDGYSGGLPISGSVGQIRVYISKFYQDMLGKGGKAKIGAFIDYLKTNRMGAILETNESNNSKNVVFDKSLYPVVPSNVCDNVSPELAKDICKTQGGSFICIDKYTQWYSACVPAAADCAKKIKTTMPCEVDWTNGQPYIDTVEVLMGGEGWEATKTFKLSSALGTYPKNGTSEPYTLNYPADKKGKIDVVRVRVSAKNAKTDTQYGFYIDQQKDYSGITYPNDHTVFKSKFNKVQWTLADSYQFVPDPLKSDSFTLYTGVKNSDQTYFAFPVNQIADDAIAIQINPSAPAPDNSTPPTSTPISAPPANNPPVSSSSSTSGLWMTTQFYPVYGPKTLGNNQLLADYKFISAGDTLCLEEISADIKGYPTGTLQFGNLRVVDFATGATVGSASGKVSYAPAPFGQASYYKLVLQQPICIPPGAQGNTRLQFFVDDLSLADSSYTGVPYIIHTITGVKYKSQATGEIGTSFIDAWGKPVILQNNFEIKI